MTSTEMGAASVPMMAAMMLPSAVPATARRARERDGVLAAPLFARACGSASTASARASG